MIRYRLQCRDSHVFEAWFQNSAAFDKQAESGLLSCPECGSAEVSKTLMAPALSGTKRSAPRDGEVLPPQKPATESKQVAATPQMQQALALKQQLLALRRQVEANCDPVGERFADEARKIHHGESEARGIYGTTTEAEREALADEGIEVGTLPWIRDDA